MLGTNELLIGAIDLSPYFAGYFFYKAFKSDFGQNANQICYVRVDGQTSRQDTPCYIHIGKMHRWGRVSAAGIRILQEHLKQGDFCRFAIATQYNDSTLILMGIHERLAEF